MSSVIEATQLSLPPSIAVTGSMKIQAHAATPYTAADTAKVVFQLASDGRASGTGLPRARMYPTTAGPAAPPMFPIMFMLPDREPAARPPTSMHAAHEFGTARSFAKLARASVTIARIESCTCDT